MSGRTTMKMDAMKYPIFLLNIFSGRFVMNVSDLSVCTLTSHHASQHDGSRDAMALGHLLALRAGGPRRYRSLPGDRIRSCHRRQRPGTAAH